MRRPGGYVIVSEPGGADREADTFTCCHCNNVVLVKPGCSPDELGGFCRMCMKHTCPRCNAVGKCVPFETKLEAIEKRDRLLRAAGV